MNALAGICLGSLTWEWLFMKVQESIATVGLNHYIMSLDLNTKTF